MPERHSKHLMFQHDGTCRSPACVKGGEIKAGTFGWWAVGGIVWHEGCPDPKDMLAAPVSEEEQDARIDRWMDRKIAEEAERRQQAGPSSGGTSGVATSAKGRPSLKEHPAPATPASVTSDPKYEEAF